MGVEDAKEVLDKSVSHDQLKAWHQVRVLLLGVSSFRPFHIHIMASRMIHSRIS
jgi:hypothetical protein